MLAKMMEPRTRDFDFSSFSTSASAQSAKHSAMAGYTAGVTGVVFGHPLDSIKVWLQTNSTGANRHLQQPPPVPQQQPQPHAQMQRAHMSTLSAPRPSAPKLTLSWSTLRALYSGATGPLVTVGAVQSINFACYDSLRRTLHQRDHPEAESGDYLNKDNLQNVGLAGGIAGSVLATITAPLILVKTRQQLTGQSLGTAWRETLAAAAARPRLILHGFAPHLGSEVLGRALYFVAYERLKRSFPSNKSSIPERMLSAGLAGMACWAFIFPMDSLRSRMYHQLVSSGGRVDGTLDMIRHIYHDGARPSIRHFYRGFSVTILRAGPVSACVLPVYDTMLEFLQTKDA